MPGLEDLLFAICGQNIRKVKKKAYGPNDLVLVESQTDASDNDLAEVEYRAYVQSRINETMATVGSQTDLTDEMVDLQVMDDNLWMTVDDTFVPPLALWPQPQTRAKPKVYKRKNKK
jgi:hypothetical protein